MVILQARPMVVSMSAVRTSTVETDFEICFPFASAPAPSTQPVLVCLLIFFVEETQCIGGGDKEFGISPHQM